MSRRGRTRASTLMASSLQSAVGDTSSQSGCELKRRHSIARLVRSKMWGGVLGAHAHHMRIAASITANIKSSNVRADARRRGSRSTSSNTPTACCHAIGGPSGGNHSHASEASPQARGESAAPRSLNEALGLSSRVENVRTACGISVVFRRSHRLNSGAPSGASAPHPSCSTTDTRLRTATRTRCTAGNVWSSQ